MRVGSDELVVVSYTPAATDDAPLSAAEGEVARLMAAGCSNAEIALARSTSSRTVANQVAAIFRKLRVGSRGEVVATLSGSARKPSVRPGV